MEFMKSKAFKIMNIASFCTLFVVVILNLIASFVSLSKPLLVVFVVFTCLGAVYVIGFNIASMILYAKNNNTKEKENDKK